MNRRTELFGYLRECIPHDRLQTQTGSPPFQVHVRATKEDRPAAREALILKGAAAYAS